MWHLYLTPGTLTEALELLDEYRGQARVLAGGTDVMREIDNGVSEAKVIIDITRIPRLDQIEVDDDGSIHLGPCVTHNQIATSPICQKSAFPLAQASLQVGSAQIRNRGTLAGNIVSASPAADTPPALLVLGTEVVLCSRGRGERVVSLDDFFLGLRQVAVEPDELITDIIVRPLGEGARGCFMKLADRKAMGIAIVNVAAAMSVDAQGCVTHARLALGSVASRVIRVPEAETLLTGNGLSDKVIAQAAQLASRVASPITDIRGSAQYRTWMVEVLTSRALQALWREQERAAWPVEFATLSVPLHRPFVPNAAQRFVVGHHDVIEMTVNGTPYRVEGVSNKSLVHVLRDDLGLIGTKKGCGEGRCGACTISLNGQAVMSCLVPAPCAHGCDIVTVEGLDADGELNTLQTEFYEHSAVQCGFCTPGLLMSSSILMQELPGPERETIKHALAGNLCRCTGYQRYLDAIEAALAREASQLPVAVDKRE